LLLQRLELLEFRDNRSLTVSSLLRQPVQVRRRRAPVQGAVSLSQRTVVGLAAAAAAALASVVATAAVVAAAPIQTVRRAARRQTRRCR